MRAHRLLYPLLLALVGCRPQAPAGDEHAPPAPPPGGERKAEKAGRADAHGEHEGHGHGEEEEGHAQAVQLTPEAAANARIQVVEVQQRALVAGLSVPAHVAFTHQGVGQVAARVAGRVASLEVRLGERVRKGQVLGYLESAELGQARADYLSAVTRAQVARDNLRREKELLAKGITSERDMREAESAFVTAQAERNAADTRLHALGLLDADIQALKGDEHYSSRFPARSPLSGTVVAIQASVGQAVEGTTPLFTVGDLTQLWVLLDVSEMQLAAVEVGQPVGISVQAYPGRRFEGRVQHVGDIVDERTRTVDVRVAVPNPDGVLKPGMFATAEIATQRADAGGSTGPLRLVVPREAVHKVGEAQVVFVPEGEHRFKAVPVQTGASTAAEVEVVSGLAPGERVVTQGAFVLKSELSKESMGHGHSH